MKRKLNMKRKLDLPTPKEKSSEEFILQDLDKFDEDSKSDLIEEESDVELDDTIKKVNFIQMLPQSDEEREDGDISEEEEDSSEPESEDEDDRTTSSMLKNRSSVNAMEKDKKPATEDEYAIDSSDEEDLRNTVGNIPMDWYKTYPHLGYNQDGRKILRPPQKDQLEGFLARMEDPDFMRTVFDKMTGQSVVLSDQDVRMIKRLQKGKLPDESYNMYEPWVDFFTYEVMKMPVFDRPEHKRSFIPSISEKEKISRMVHSLKMGWMKFREEREKEKERPKFYLLWEAPDQTESMRRIHDHIPAPKEKLPETAESYNPPKEYLFTEAEREKWEKLEEEPWKRKLNFIPQAYSSLREVPAYERLIKERFDRCLDLYLAPRMRKMRAEVAAEDLLPELPKPQDLHPFPTTESLVFEGHTDLVRTISVEPIVGQYVLSGSDDGTARVWEVSTGRCLKIFQTGGVIRSVAWCPSQAVTLVAIASENRCLIVNVGVGDKLKVSHTDVLLSSAPAVSSSGREEEGEKEVLTPERVKTAVQWEEPSPEEKAAGVRIVLKHFKTIKQVTWHGKGDYLATVMPDAQNRAVLIHQLSRRRSQQPFDKAKGAIQCVKFHPVRPFLFVATQRQVRVYNLVKQELSKKLMTGLRWISSIAVHPGGDNVLVGSYDSKLQWFDMDLSTKPYRVMRHHTKAVREVAYHRKYPLFASGSDDGSIIVSHGMVYSDLLQNPLIVPVKILKGHKLFNDFCVLSVAFHPNQPWLFSSGADSTIRLYT
ncbi:unnamed protein product [Cyprideis torosa]|uniref:Ribosome biogenesis protein BOP1 homolog n=1 Tax=Cyprideis torosa TaxID=163714 RepID=A0A7R8W4N2_9CRUS|nr:unnamed protein product [Cyprideis torosa]CAG0884367.1 unnamed protein product [Cyprideis torosa]